MDRPGSKGSESWPGWATEPVAVRPRPGLAQHGIHERDLLQPLVQTWLTGDIEHHTTWLRPSSITQRYSRMCARLGWDMHIHQLRHYSATELISAGVDVRTVAGRLGHGGGGSTTLRVYSAWISESDQKAAGAFTVRMPAPPIGLDNGSPDLLAALPVPDGPTSPYERIAAGLRGAIMCGALNPGDLLPTVGQLKDPPPGLGRDSEQGRRGSQGGGSRHGESWSPGGGHGISDGISERPECWQSTARGEDV